MNRSASRCVTRNEYTTRHLQPSQSITTQCERISYVRDGVLDGRSDARSDGSHASLLLQELLLDTMRPSSIISRRDSVVAAVHII